MIITITEPLVQFEPQLSHALVNKRFRFKSTLLSAEFFYRASVSGKSAGSVLVPGRTDSGLLATFSFQLSFSFFCISAFTLHFHEIAFVQFSPSSIA